MYEVRRGDVSMLWNGMYTGELVLKVEIERI
jgi:hypothetical protein